ncbi:hypothetical protein Hsc_3808 [Herbaspirillum seropedicae]|nr:hypothetical protein Hsc_3808 [Herbaspirillum seropedicae]
MGRIGQLYAIEARVRGKPPDERGKYDNPKQGRRSMHCKYGGVRSWKRCRVNRIRWQQFCMCSTADRRWNAIERTVPLNSTIRQQSAPCAVWHGEGRMTCSPVPIPT